MNGDRTNKYGYMTNMYGYMTNMYGKGISMYGDRTNIYGYRTSMNGDWPGVSWDIRPPKVKYRLLCTELLSVLKVY